MRPGASIDRVDHDALVDLYGRYIGTCNQHRFRELGAFVHDDVGGDVPGLAAYVAGLEQVVSAFPDYHWEIEHVLVDGDHLAARLTATGTHTGTFRGIEATGRRLTTMELAMYRWYDGRIAHCWGDLGSTVRDALVSGD